MDIYLYANCVPEKDEPFFDPDKKITMYQKDGECWPSFEAGTSDVWCSEPGQVHQITPRCGRVCSSPTYRGVKDLGLWDAIESVPCSTCPDATWPGCENVVPKDAHGLVIEETKEGVSSSKKKQTKIAKENKTAKKKERNTMKFGQRKRWFLLL